MKVIVLQLETKREEELLEEILKSFKEKSENKIEEKKIQDILESLSMEGFLDEIYNKNNENRMRKVTSILKKIGIPTNMIGFEYIRKGIINMLDNENRLKMGITKNVYIDLSKEYKTSTACIERGVRYAIEFAWQQGNQDLIKSICRCGLNETRPSNSEFLLSIVDLIKLNENE